ncbi:DUF4396 domain-containing protein [Streptomyces sp. SID7813]|uniref:Membrane protein n=4 Tax=Streptomyces TaxID=1883 RepID=Q9X8F3_STRCO|nr:DUF4396 domain-containing protein [Streptomyces sp. SID7813]QFI43341.1 DUF4396 domain-containing protein [Streptomyces coelicolor A3(2)]CAB40338.1 putative membrane protein [Streptomyces coelicolor A3(2)]
MTGPPPGLDTPRGYIFCVMDHDMDHSTHHSAPEDDGPGHPHGHGHLHGPGHPHGHVHVHGTTWATAMQATLHCLTGCAIGEILGMVIGTALMWGNVPTMVLAIALAFVFGYSLTLFAVVRAGVSMKAAIKVALAADTVSIAVMELVDNGIIALVPGAMEAHLSDGLFWYALLGGFAVAFVITTPVNKWMIGRGKGHAVVHAYH